MGQDKRPLGSETKTKSIESENVDSNPVVTETVEQKPVKPRHSKSFSFVSVLFLLALLAAGVMTYLWYETDQDRKSAESAVSSLKNSQDTSDDNISSDDLLAPASDQDQITNASTTFICATGVLSCESLKIEITQLQNDQDDAPAYAKAEATDESDNKTDLYLKRTDNEQGWAVVYEGVSQPTEEIVKKYGLPGTLLSKTEA